MSETPPPAPGADEPPHAARRAGGPAVRTFRVTAPDLARRDAMEKTRARLLLAAVGFGLLFLAVGIKLTGATVVVPLASKRLERLARAPELPPIDAPGSEVVAPPPPRDIGPRTRAQIVDRNGEILAMSQLTAGLYANPREMIDTAEAAAKLKAVLPRLDLETVRTRLASDKQFVYLARNITPREQLAVNNLGIPGVYFQPTERRRYPQGRMAAQVLGGVDVDAHGVAGVERFFDQRLRDNPDPLRLSIDIRVEAAVRDELLKAMTEFQAIGACGIVMDVRTGEVIAMVSLPDYDANKVGEAKPEERFNRAVTGMYEPGSTFKLQTAAAMLETGAGHLWNTYDASHDIQIGRFTISDFQGKHRVLTFPEVLVYSSNLGASRMAQALGGERQRSWLQNMGMFTRIGVELPEEGKPIVQKAENWKEIATMTVGFGHGIAVSPLHVVRGTAALSNGGVVLRPTVLAAERDGPPPEGTRVMQQSTSDTMRKLMRLVVTDGYGKPADVPGYFVGGKTGTAEKTSGHGYKKHANISAFMSVFPMNAPRYAVYFMLDEPKGNASTGGYSTAGAVSAPGAGRVIARIAPMLGMTPETTTAAATQASLAMPLQVARPAGYRDPPVAHTPVPAHPAAGRPTAAGAQHREAALAPPLPALSEMLRALELAAPPDLPVGLTGLTADSRAVRPGMLFAALPGARADGRAFIGDAVARGAAAVLAPPDTAWPEGVPARPLILDPEPRRVLARLAAAYAGPQPETVVAVTGTNGKTSTVEFLRQMFAGRGVPAASIGALGVVGPEGTGESGLTTPGPVELSAALARLARDGVRAAALEASSHGLEQFRLDGLRLTAAGFSNLTHDHLDYHGTMDAYRAAKLRLFDALLPSGAPAVASATLDAETMEALRAVASRRGLRLHVAGGGLRAEPHPSGQTLHVDDRSIELPLPGRFQADNALLAAALAEAVGVADPLALLPGLRGVRGRLELVAEPRGAAVYVDYAHTPDALERLLLALRPHTAGRLVLVFGAGGDRDAGKRPLMGAIAARFADAAIVTDDNPRGEDPAAIRAAIRARCPEAAEIGDRAAAIAAGLEMLRAGDVLAVAGKGHESGQTVRGVVTPFDDAAVIRQLVGA